MSNFYYDPGVQDRRGELLAQGLTEGFAAAAQAIQNGVQTHKRVKEKRAQADTYTLMMGGDPGGVKKMNEYQLDAFNSVAPALIQRDIQEKAGQHIARFLQSYGNRLKGGPNLPATLAQGRGPLASPVMEQPMAPGPAMASALAANPDVFSDSKTGAQVANLAKTIASMSAQGPGVDPSTGLRTWGGKPLNAALQRLLTSGGAAAPTLNFTAAPGGGEVATFGNRAFQVRPPTADNSHRGMLPPRTKIQIINGRTVAVTPDGWMKPLPTNNGDAAWQQIEANGSAPGQPGAGGVAGTTDAGNARETGMQNATDGTDEFPTPTRLDVSYLAEHPELKEKFEARFGPGSADEYLP